MGNTGVKILLVDLNVRADHRGGGVRLSGLRQEIGAAKEGPGGERFQTRVVRRKGLQKGLCRTQRSAEHAREEAKASSCPAGSAPTRVAAHMGTTGQTRGERKLPENKGLKNDPY